MWVLGLLERVGVPDLAAIQDKVWAELETPSQPQINIRPPDPPLEPLHKRQNRAWVAFNKAMLDQERLEDKLWKCEQQLDKLRDRRAGLWRESKEMAERVGARKAEVDKLFGAAVVDGMLAGVEKVDVEGLGKVRVDMGDGGAREGHWGAEVHRLDQDDWMDQEPPYAVPVGDDGWGEGGSGGSTPCKGAGEGAGEAEDRAVERYWEDRGRSPSVATDVREEDVLDYEGGGGAEDAGMDLVETEELEGEEEEWPKSWTEELRIGAKKRRTDGDKGRREELQAVRDLGRVRQAAFDKRK